MTLPDGAPAEVGVEPRPRNESSHWLRLVAACADPRLQQIEANLASPAATVWLQRAQSGQEPDDAAALLQTVRLEVEALRRSASVPERVDPILRDEVLGVLAEHAPPELARWACEALRDLEARPVDQPEAASAIGPGSSARRIGSYVLGAAIGHGASSAVFRAHHVDNGLPAAVKLLRIETADAAQVLRFRREAQITARLQHPAIVRLLDSGVESRDGVAIPYLVSVLVEGQPFAAALRGATTERIVAVFLDLAEAIAHAHRCGVLHRDLKSQNVLVDAEGRVHVLDFGIARMLEPRDLLHTGTGQILGSPQTMSPEQAAGRSLDVRSDLWSLGAMLFEVLSGEVPFDLRGLSGAAAIRRIAETEPRRLDRLRRDLDADLVAVVHQSIAAAPADRYRSVEALVADLRLWLAGETVTARAPGFWGAAWRLARRHRLATSALVAVVAAVGLGGGLAAWQWLRARAAEGEARSAALHALDTMENTLYAYARLVELATDVEEQRRLLARAVKALPGIRAVPLPSEAERWMLVEARLREFQGDLAVRAQDLHDAEQRCQQVLQLQQTLRARGASSVANLARAMVKVGDVHKLRGSGAAIAFYRSAHAQLLAAAASPEAELEVLDDLGWSFERLAAWHADAGEVELAWSYAAERVEHAERLLARQDDALRHYGLGSALGMLRTCSDLKGLPRDAAAFALRERAAQAALEAVRREPERRAFLELAVAIHLQIVVDEGLATRAVACAAAAEAQRLTMAWLRLDPRDLGANRRRRDVLEVLARLGPEPPGADPAAEGDALWQAAVQQGDVVAGMLAQQPDGRVGVQRLRMMAWLAATIACWPSEGRWRDAVTAGYEAALSRADTTVGELADFADWLGVAGPPELRDPARAADLAFEALCCLGDTTPAGQRDAAETVALRLGLFAELAALPTSTPRR